MVDESNMFAVLRLLCGAVAEKLDPWSSFSLEHRDLLLVYVVLNRSFGWILRHLTHFRSLQWPGRCDVSWVTLHLVGEETKVR